MLPTEWLATEPGRLADLVLTVAPGPAGAVAGWTAGVGDDDGAGPAPGLWRVGTGVLTVTRDGEPWPVAVPLLDEAHLTVTTTPATRAQAEELVEALVLRTLRFYRPGTVHLDVWDAARLAGALPGLYPLTRTGLRVDYRPDELSQLLDKGLSRQITRVHTRVLTHGLPTVKSAAAERGTRDEPWHVAVLLGDGRPLPDREHQLLEQVARTGLSCGVCLILVDVPLARAAPTQWLRFDPGRVSTSMAGRNEPHVAVVPDPPLHPAEVTATCHRIADRHEELRSYVGSFTELLPPLEQWGTGSSQHGLVIPIGFVESKPTKLRLGEAPHVLVGGPTGKGKTTVLLGMIAAAAAIYPPSELRVLAVDFKKGVSFQLLATCQDGTWLPHADLVGVECDDDPEFGLGLLQHVKEEMRRRAAAMKRHGVSNLAELRAADPAADGARWLIVIDEFPVMLPKGDPATAVAARLLTDIAQRTRSFGLHLVLASQDVTSIEAFWGKPAFWRQLVVRIAMPQAMGVLRDDDAAMALPPYTAILNHSSGAAHDNVVVRIPNVSEPGGLDAVRRWAHGRYPSEPPRLFDGARPLHLGGLRAGLPPGFAVIGQQMDFAGSPATVDFTPDTGRNLAVIGSTIAQPVLAWAAESLIGQGKQVHLDLAGGVMPDALTATLAELWEEIRARRGASGDPVYVVVQAADAAPQMLDKAGQALWKGLLQSGPELGIHVLGWWRSARRLKALTGPGGIPLDDLGVLVGVDVQGDAFGSLVGGPILLPWDPDRSGRALFFDRAHQSYPKVILVPEGDAE